VTATGRRLALVVEANGVPAPMEARLLAAMPADWLLHHRLDRGIGGGATSVVVIDLSLLAARVAVEIDGRSHCLTAQKARDREKEEFLLARGFRVIRVSNEQVRTSLEPTVAFITAVAARPAADQTARPW
jgi:very-short-patch-repair endonuclease